MIRKDYIILAPEGIHARPAAALVKLARGFKAAVYLIKGEKTVQLNSLLNLLQMGAKGGDTITVSIEGEDEVVAAEALDQFFSELKA
jgi:phosphocarrier protein HPr